jgi:hypothetical protein
MAHLQDILIRLEPLFLLLAAIAFFKSGSARRFPAVGTFFALRGASWLLLDWVLCRDGMPHCGTLRYTIYFYTYWISYAACAVAIFFVVQEVFKRVMEPVPGLRRLGLLVFRWISIVSVVICVGAIALPAALATTNGDRIGPLCLQTARCVSVMELCLLAFLALAIHALGRSFRSRLFGIGLGFGLQAAADLIFTALAVRYPGLTSTAALALQIVTNLVLLTFAVYFAVPEPEAERKLIVLPPQSMLARWNALAKGLGQLPEVAVAQPTGFFLQDIESVVDRVLAKNPAMMAR